GSHHVDLLRTLLGEPRSVLGSVRIEQPLRGPTADDPRSLRATADDAFTILLEWEGGAHAVLDISASSPYRWERFEVHGSDAALRWDESGYALWRIVAGHEPEAVEIPTHLQLEPRSGDPALVAPFGVLVDRLHRAIAHHEPMSPDFDDAVAVQRVLDAARASSAAGTRMHVDVP
ncbi:MAG: hypothetical protein HOP12_09610, partial [Candidatus Eisenbacteria bacterium]|nr:hypothetical protein [Candidatus Eisenbacteria bacterium]